MACSSKSNSAQKKTQSITKKKIPTSKPHRTQNTTQRNLLETKLLPRSVPQLADFCNYQRVEGDEDVAAELERHIKNKFARRFKSLAPAREYLNADPILSKIGVVKKLRGGKWKIRMVIESERSGVSKATRKIEPTQLPRALDVVSDVMTLMSSH